ncbi:MAG: HAD-IC family P-type ATPase [Candidatus Paceibacterota bacterium]
MEKPWHLLSLKEVFKFLGSSINGLTDKAAEEGLKKYGANILPQEKPYSKLKLFFSQFNNPLIAILLFTCGVSVYLGHYSDAIFVIVVLLINILVGFYQENKANASIKALKRMVKISARVLRDDNKKEIDSSELVPGDIIYLRAGDKVPADARLLEQKDLRVNEASLTGEWLAVSKSINAVPEKSPLAERVNMVYMGTIIEEGTATAIVVETGPKTAFGGIVSLLKETKERQTPLQQKIASLSRLVGIFIMSIVGLVMLIGYFTEKTFAEIFIASLALAVSAIPEGLLPAITVILTLGMRRILKEKGLVRKLIANETLGSVTVICTDKTGTLTEGKMQVSHILTGTNELLNNSNEPMIDITKANGLESHILALKAAVLSNEAFIENPDDEFHNWVVRGRPTERALLIAGTHAGLSQKRLLEEYPLIDKLGFKSEAKFSASLHHNLNGGKILYVIGAPEIVSARSIDFYVDGKKERLDSDSHKSLLVKLEALTQKGLRVIACAYQEFSPNEDVKNLEESSKQLTLIGYVAIKDPLREDARDSIALAKRAGIRIVLITGDHRLTALSIANEVGIDSTEETIIEGKDIDLLSDQELAERAKTISIYARVSPEHKLRIVQALQSQKEVVAMLGDGVNDAPALKMADVGVAVGSGTDVAKEVADMVLLDDNFKTVVKAIEQGRVIFQNIRKVFVYLVADDFSELFLFLAAMSLGLPLPLVAAQILWINLVEDGFPDIALTTEQEIAGVMDEKPRDPDEPILNKPLRNWMISIFFISGLAALLSFIGFWRYTGSLEIARTMTFALMCFDSLTFAFIVRSFKRPLWRKDIFSNKFLNGAVVISFVLLLLAVYFPPLNKILSTQPLVITSWFMIMMVGIVEIILIESMKKKIFNNHV